MCRRTLEQVGRLLVPKHEFMSIHTGVLCSGSGVIPTYWDAAYAFPGTSLSNNNLTIAANSNPTYFNQYQVVLANAGRAVGTGTYGFEVTYAGVSGSANLEIGLGDHTVDAAAVGYLGNHPGAVSFNMNSTAYNNGSTTVCHPTEGYNNAPNITLLCILFNDGSVRVYGPNGWVNRTQGSFGGTNNELYAPGTLANGSTVYPGASVVTTTFSGNPIWHATLNPVPTAYVGQMPAGSKSWDGSTTF